MEGCLICGGPQSPTKFAPPLFPPSAAGDEDNFVIGDQLWSIFILRRFLQLPKETCEQLLLHTFGLSPGGWFALCQGCSQVARNAFQTFSRILELERELEGLREEAKVRLRRSLEEESRHEGISHDVFSTREEIRSYFRERHQPLATREVEVEARVSESKEQFADEEGICMSEGEEVECDCDYNPNPSEVDSEDDEDIKEKRQVSNLPLPPTKRQRGRPKGCGTSSKPPPTPTTMKRGRGRPKGSGISSKSSSPPTTTRRRRGRPKGSGTPAPAFTSKGLMGPRRKKGPKPKPDDNYKCDKCDFITRYSNIFQTHLKQHKIKDHIVESANSPKSFLCAICNQEFRLRNEVVQHLRDNHGEQLGIQIFRCSSCEKVFDDRVILTNHVRIVHLGIKRKFCCDVCGAGYSHWEDFEDHKAKHGNDGRSVFICDLCGVEMSNRRTLFGHRKKYHPRSQEAAAATGEEEEDQKFGAKCPQCDIKVLHSYALKVHLKAAHADLYKFPCDLCDATYMRAASLQIHKTAAHGEKVKCPYCERMIRCESYLAQHYTRHCKSYPGKKS